MQTLAILINKSSLKIEPTQKINVYDIKNFIDYKLAPYKSLGLFSYNRYTADFSHIDGNTSAVLLIKETLNWSQIRLNHINNYFCDSTRTNLQHNIPNYYLRLLSGEFMCENQFFNCENNSSILSTTELFNIQQNPSNYLLFFTHLYQ